MVAEPSDSTVFRLKKRQMPKILAERPTKSVYSLNDWYRQLGQEPPEVSADKDRH